MYVHLLDSVTLWVGHTDVGSLVNTEIIESARCVDADKQPNPQWVLGIRCEKGSSAQESHTG